MPVEDVICVDVLIPNAAMKLWFPESRHADKVLLDALRKYSLKPALIALAMSCVLLVRSI